MISDTISQYRYLKELVAGLKQVESELGRSAESRRNYVQQNLRVPRYLALSAAAVTIVTSTGVGFLSHMYGPRGATSGTWILATEMILALGVAGYWGLPYERDRVRLRNAGRKLLDDRATKKVLERDVLETI